MMTQIIESDMCNYEELGCLDEIFKKQAQTTPDATAVVNVDGSIVRINITLLLLIK